MPVRGVSSRTYIAELISQQTRSATLPGWVSTHCTSGLSPLSPALHPIPTTSARTRLRANPSSRENRELSPGTMKPVEVTHSRYSTSAGESDAAPNAVRIARAPISSAPVAELGVEVGRGLGERPAGARVLRGGRGAASGCAAHGEAF